MKSRIFFNIILLSALTLMMSAAAYASDNASPLVKRLDKLKKVKERSFLLIPYKPNYIIYTYNTLPNYDTSKIDGIDLRKDEAKFQISFWVPLKQLELSGDDILSFNFGYTQQSYFQVLNSDESRPVRESNYEPELMLTLLKDFSGWGVTNREITLGVWHQSNGRSDAVPGGTTDDSLSRSWNRLYLRFFAEAGNFCFILQPWWIMPHSDSDNADIENYLGNGDLTIIYHDDNQELSLFLRNNLHFDSVNRGAFEMDYSVPVSKRISLYAQFYNGYGESLIDYDHKATRLGVGIRLSEWL